MTRQELLQIAGELTKNIGLGIFCQWSLWNK